ncbi:MAG TPA: zf-TFIIB domain-containing protein [Magnetospirillum sp.]|nr:zf-TFIIB domain-containing protein [Magnetospirillum sp.]
MPLLICPNCNVGMARTYRSGIAVDVCPLCRSLWLDRAEVEKLLQPLRTEPPAHARPAMAETAPALPWHRPPYVSPPCVSNEHGGLRGRHDETGLKSLFDLFG